MNTITLVLGDWSNDGHGNTDHIQVVVNCTKAELEDAFIKGCAALGWEREDWNKLRLPFAEQYEDCTIPDEYLEALNTASLDVRAGHDSYEYLDPDLYAHLWLSVARLGRPGLTWEFPPTSSIKIGGYGLFT